MTTTVTESELGRHLLTVRGFHFVLGALGDPFARLLNGEGDDAAALGAEIRRRGPLHRSELGAWVTADAGVAAALLAEPGLDTRHPDAGQDHVRENLWETWRTCHVTPAGGAPLTLPLAEYARLARLCDPVLGPRTAGAWRADVRGAVLPVLDRLGPRFDLVTDLVRPAVAAAVAKVLGVPVTAADLATPGVALDAVLCPPRLPVALELEEAIGRVRELARAQVAERAVEPRDDAVSALLATGYDRADVVEVCLLHLVAGAEIATGALTGAVEALLGRPGQWAALRRDPDLAARAVEETLRWAPPVRLVSRIAQRPLTVAGQEIEADDHVVILVDAANRDPSSGAGDFDLAGEPGPSLSLTGGGYESLVAPPARVIATEVLRAVAERLPGIEIDGPPLRRMRSPVARAVLKLPMAKGR
ncbi:P450-derived glycosyltransferase activator [Nonomuraea sp. MCN248]|uniref:P450-derived glycosyltransferase activator n=1 Tax=Nonomuraea corallina TaxID=2989783 RepID=A0ABT4S6H1_9ACTN|nr:P450-derived glycosyltransferase activator [Nonomuraea corallina]MDA0632777.1 P450-derived glycosyltransferase activator [Nonomuraea corallina]